MQGKGKEPLSKSKLKTKEHSVNDLRGGKSTTTTESHLEVLAPSTTNMAADNSVKPSEFQQPGEILSKNMIAMQQSLSKITDVLFRITEEENLVDDDRAVDSSGGKSNGGRIIRAEEKKTAVDTEDQPEVESNNDNRTLNDIAQALQLEQKSSPKVSEQLAKVVNGVVQTRLSDEVENEKLNAYNRPENCDSLVNVKVNH